MKPVIIHKVPGSVYDRLAQGVIVSRLQPNGRFTDTYVADLVSGDEFYVDQKELPARTGDQILVFIAENEIGFEWEEDIDGNTTGLTVTKGFKDSLVTYPFNGSKLKTLMEAVEYVMDQEEL